MGATFKVSPKAAIESLELSVAMLPCKALAKHKVVLERVHDKDDKVEDANLKWCQVVITKAHSTLTETIVISLLEDQDISAGERKKKLASTNDRVLLAEKDLLGSGCIKALMHPKITSEMAVVLFGGA